MAKKLFHDVTLIYLRSGRWEPRDLFLGIVFRSALSQRGGERLMVRGYFVYNQDYRPSMYYILLHTTLLLFEFGTTLQLRKLFAAKIVREIRGTRVTS